MLLVWLLIVSSPRHVSVKGFVDRLRLSVKGAVKRRFSSPGRPGVDMTAITAPRGPSMPTATGAAVTIRGK